MTGNDARSPLPRKPLRNPGQGLDERLDFLINEKLLWYLLFPAFFWIIAGLEWLSGWRHLPRMPGTYAMAALVLTVLGAWRFWLVKREIDRVKLGRDGELIVAETLAELQVDGARVFHDVPAPGFNLDHVLVCDRGVFVIETKTWSKPQRGQTRIQVREGKVFKNGRTVDRDPIGQVQGAASWLGQALLERTGHVVRVWPVVVFPGWYVEMDAATKARAWVLEPKMLPGWLVQEPQRLSLEQVRVVAGGIGRLVRGE